MFDLPLFQILVGTDEDGTSVSQRAREDIHLERQPHIARDQHRRAPAISGECTRTPD